MFVTQNQNEKKTLKHLKKRLSMVKNFVSIRIEHMKNIL